MSSKDPKVIQSDVTWMEITPGGVIYDAGNSREFITGDWSTRKPVLIQEKCNNCLLCVPVCPDSSIHVINGKRSDFDYKYCKGCGICAKQCPFGAIEF